VKQFYQNRARSGQELFSGAWARERKRRGMTRKLSRAKVLGFFASLAPCRVGMEACGSAHYWARELVALGHAPVLIAPAYVKPYVKRCKSDAADACGNLRSDVAPAMRFVRSRAPISRPS